MTGPTHQPSEILRVSSLIFVAIVGAAVLMLLPIIIGSLSGSFSAKEVGFIGGADMLGAAVAAFFVGPLIQKVSWRSLTLGAVVILTIVNATTAYSEEFVQIVGLRLIAGISEGVLLSIGNTGLANSTRPDRTIATYLVVALLAGALGIQVFSHIAGVHGLSGIFLGLAGFSAVAVLAVRFLPTGPRHVESRSIEEISIASTDGMDKNSNLQAILGVVGVLLYFTALGLIWGNMSLIGTDAGLSGSLIDKALSLSLIFGMIGGIAAMALEAKLGRALPVLVSMAFSILAITAMFWLNPVVFFAATAALMFGWNFTYPYQVAAVATVDQTGTYVSKCVSMQLLGFSLGPLIAGVLLSWPNGFAILKSLAASAFIVAALFLAPALLQRTAAQR